MKSTETISKDSLQQPNDSQPGSLFSSENINRWRTHLTGKSFLFTIGVIALLIVVLVFVNIFGHKKAKAEPNLHTPVLTVTIQQASRKPMEQVLAVHGSVLAWDPISVGATTSGLEVKAVLVDEGDIVKKGQVLARLDADQLNAQLESEKARLSASLANAYKSIQPNRIEDINGLRAALAQAEATIGSERAALTQAQANLANARINTKRYQLLRSEGAVSAQEAEARETTAQVNEATVLSAEKQVQAAEFAMKQAQERLKMAQIGGRREDIQIAKATVAEIQGNIKRLATQIEQTKIKAPIDGLITRRDVHLGDISSTGKTLFLMARDNRIELRAEVPENDLRLVQAGQIVSINASFLGKENVEGKVREISPLVDTGTRLAIVRIDIPSKSGLKQGMYAEGHIQIGKSSALTVPAAAVISSDEKHTVFVLHTDQVEKRPVVVGNRNNDFVQISEGLRENELVVVNGAGFLKDGDYVSVAR